MMLGKKNICVVMEAELLTSGKVSVAKEENSSRRRLEQQFLHPGM